MKTVDFKLNGTTYKLCFSLRVFSDAMEEHGSIYNLLNAIESEDFNKQQKVVLDLGEKLIEAGATLERKRGCVGNVISAAEILENSDMLDYYKLRAAIVETMKKTEPIIQLEQPEGDSKNAVASAER